MIPKLVHNLVERTATSVSTNATTDRAATCTGSYNNNNNNNNYACHHTLNYSPAASAACSSSSNNNYNYNTNYNINNGNKILACSPSLSSSSSSSSSHSPSVQSLQAKLLAARKRNELLEQIEKGVDADGYTLCQYRKGFVDHLKLRSLITSVSKVLTIYVSTVSIYVSTVSIYLLYLSTVSSSVLICFVSS